MAPTYGYFSMKGFLPTKRAYLALGSLIKRMKFTLTYLSNPMTDCSPIWAFCLKEDQAGNSSFVDKELNVIKDQWRERLRSFLPSIEVGVFGGGKKSPTGIIDEAAYQSLINKLNDTPPLHLIRPEERPKITDAYRWIMENKKRTQQIVSGVISSIREGKHPIVLTERREHAGMINNLS
jgi:hypothetical protein